MSELKGKTALVTGGSRGIGAAIALKLASEGADVVVTYSSSESEAERVCGIAKQGGVEAFAIKADAREPQQVIDAVRQVVSKFKKIDILVNNAGIFELRDIREASLEDFDRTMNVNVKSVFAATAEAVKSMPDNGRIITIGSIFGETLPLPGCSLYGMSKGAVNLLTRGWARDLGARGITVNVIQPGPIDTDMNPASGEMGDKFKSMAANKRYGKPEEVAELALFLASPRSSNITGAAINVDGGVTA